MANFKIYTKTGDTGQTSLVGGTRISKDHKRIETYGTVDELNAFVGVLNDQLTNQEIKDNLLRIQNKLFVLGSLIAYDGSKNVKLAELKEEEIFFLEDEMDKMDELLPALKSFVLPGGHPQVSACHVCRVVCRRAERQLIGLSKEVEIADLHIKYLNRLSDYFFMLSRRLSQIIGIEEMLWKP